MQTGALHLLRIAKSTYKMEVAAQVGFSWPGKDPNLHWISEFEKFIFD